MTSDEHLKAEIAKVSEALSARTEDVRQFIGEFFPKLTGVDLTGDGQAALVSVLVKQMVSPFFHAFPSPAPRKALREALEQMSGLLLSVEPEDLH